MIDQKTKEKIIEEYMKSSSGRSKLAQTMIRPLRQKMFQKRCVLCGEPCEIDHANSIECEIAEVIES